MKTILLLAHGNLAKSMKMTAEMLFGQVPDITIDFLDLEEHTGVAPFRKKLTCKINHFRENNMIVLTDLRGGTPFNEAYALLLELGLASSVPLLYGMNIPLLISLLFLEGGFGQDDIHKCIEEAKENIGMLKM